MSRLCRQHNMINHIRRVLNWSSLNPRLSKLPKEVRLLSTSTKGKDEDDKSFIRFQDGISMRAMKQSDYPGLCELSRQAFGSNYKTDYLPGWFSKILEDNNRMTCLCEKHGKIIGFGMVLGGVDNGKSLLYEAGRIHPDVSSAGLFGRILIYLSSLATQRWPDWQNTRNCSIYTKYYDQNPEKVNILARRTILTVKLPPTLDLSKTMPSIAPVHTRPITQLSADQFKSVLANNSNLSLLFPDNLLVVGYNGFSPLPSNVPFITYFHDNIFIDADMKHGVSVGGGVECDDNRAWRYNFTYSGRVDFYSCLCHVKKHLTLVLQDIPPTAEALYLVLSLPKGFRNALGEDALYFGFQEMFGVDRKDIDMKTQYATDYK